MQYQTMPTSPQFPGSPRPRGLPTFPPASGSPPFASPGINGHGPVNGFVRMPGSPSIPPAQYRFNGLKPDAHMYLSGHVSGVSGLLGYPSYVAHRGAAATPREAGGAKDKPSSVLDQIKQWEVGWVKTAMTKLNETLRERSQKHNPFAPEEGFVIGTIKGLVDKVRGNLKPEKEQRSILRHVARLKQVEHPVWVAIDTFAHAVEEFYEEFYEEPFTEEAFEKLGQDEGAKAKLELERLKAFKKKMEDRNSNWLPQRELNQCKETLKQVLKQVLETDPKDDVSHVSHNIVGDRAPHDCLLMAAMRPSEAGTAALHALCRELMTAKDFQPDENPAYSSDLGVFKRIVQERTSQEDKTKYEYLFDKEYNYLFHKVRKDDVEEVLKGEQPRALTRPWTFKAKDDPGLYTGETALHMCIMFEAEEMVKWILKRQTDTKWISGGQEEKDLKCVQSRATGLYFKPEKKRLSHELSRPRGNERKWPTLFTDRDIDKIVDENPDAFFANRHDDKYLGELPLQWAATAGATRICQIIKEHVEELVEKVYPKKDPSNDYIDKAYTKWVAVINEPDTLGNTPLHMAAMHGRKDTFDWLLENGAFESFSKVNVSGQTPLTLCVWLGDVDMYQHVALKTSPLLWNFGSDDLVQELRFTNLEMIDSYVIEEKEEDKEKEEKKSKERPWTLCERLREEQRKGTQNSGDLKKHMSPEEAEDFWRKKNKNVPLHKRPYWRSAFEIITRKEMKEFSSEEIFQELVNHKWLNFGRNLYLWYVLFRYLAVMAIFMVAVLNRTPTMSERFADDLFVEIPRGWDALNDTSGILFVLLSVFGGLALGQMAFQLRRITRTDLDPDGNGTIDFEELLNFAFKNLASICALVNISQFIGIVANRALGQVYDEAQLLAGTSIVLFCNLLNLLIPFRFVGILVVTIYRMLVGDVARFLFVYLILLYGFGTASYVLQQERPIDFYSDTYPEERSPYAGTGPNSASLTFVWVTLGDNNFALEIPNTRSPDVLMIVHLLFVIITNVLLLNLLISMMGDTYATNKEKTHQQWILPVASWVLYSEKYLMSDHYKAQRRFGTSGGRAMVDAMKERQEKKIKKKEKDKPDACDINNEGNNAPSGSKCSDPLALFRWTCMNGDPPFLSTNSRLLMQEHRAGKRYTMTRPGVKIVDDNEFTKAHMDKAFSDLKTEIRELLSDQKDKHARLTASGYPIHQNQMHGGGYPY